jgi:hypothetical protein
VRRFQPCGFKPRGLQPRGPIAGRGHGLKDILYIHVYPCQTFLAKGPPPDCNEMQARFIEIPTHFMKCQEISLKSRKMLKP